MSAFNLSLNSDKYDNWRWVPLLTPALKGDSCQVDHDLLLSRITKIGILALATFVASMICGLVLSSSAVIFMSAPLGGFSFISLSTLDDWKSKRAANNKAVDEYLNMPYPSSSATDRIQTEYKAAQLLVSKKGDVNKINEEGHSLLKFCNNLNVFKLLVNHGADVKLAFEEAITQEDPAYLEYLLKTKKVVVNDFTSTQQVNFWVNAKSFKSIYLLKQFGFNINIKDDSGYTPLLKTVAQASSLFSSYSYTIPRLGWQARVSALLKCGADKTATVMHQGVEKNAAQLNTNPALIPLLV